MSGKSAALRALLLALLTLWTGKPLNAFSPVPCLPSERRVKGTPHHGLWAISSRELRKREEGEKRVLLERRKKAAKRKLGKTATSTTTGKKTTSDASSSIGTKVKSTSVKKQKSKASLTQRLQRATAKAKAAAIEADYASKKQQVLEESSAKRPFSNSTATATRSSSTSSTRTSSTTEQPRLATLTQLTRIIDKELRAASDGTATFNVHGTTNPPPGITRDSMRSLLEENDAQWQKSQRQQQRAALAFGVNLTTTTTSATTNAHLVKHVAVVISKPLVQDQVTLEYACRLRTLAKAMQSDNSHEEENKKTSEEEEEEGDATNNEEGPYQPTVICFLGGTCSGNLVSDADAGYIYFKHLCEANQISLEGVDILLEKTTLGKGALKHVMRHLMKEYVPEWLKEPVRRTQGVATDSDDYEDEDDMEDDYHHRIIPTPFSVSRNKVQLHFTLFSSDYDLCRINDIHYRSPQQSVLRHLLELEQEGRGGNSNRGMVQTTWSYRFSTYPYVHFKDAMTAHLGKCYLLAEELTPVLVNIRGVVDGTEFFQRDNYRVLVSIRRSFVNDMEHFYKSQPSLKSTLRQYVSNSDYPLDVVLEGALLSLGRCLDLVRPAGLLIGYVPKDDWKTAERVLQHAVRQLRDACDPDHPLDPTDWGKLDHCYYDNGAGSKSATDFSENDLMELTQWRIQEEGDDDEEM
ncbi:expressed unknown protein [Seminavis robusta]|uniref:Uncharacterized protein n=1 Tax=Seminavis robusta TaxID=568900 RepID=A0A9N8ECT2_9STRA|nr:expressed unknown protein [Seminavis robusta]|eukprot:Sro901_g218040.1 n/a (691) ;mRNA; f:28705-30925